MGHRTGSVVIGILLLVSISASAQGLGVRSVGVRLAMPIGQPRVWLGVEVTSGWAESLLSFVLFLTSRGETLFLAHADIPVQEGNVCLRLSTGFFFFEEDQVLPYPVIGAGLASRALAEDPWHVNLAGEFLYPIAFPLPMVSTSFGWVF